MSARITFRVSRIPSHLTRTTLAGYLASAVPDLGDEDNIHVQSLATTPESFRASPEKIATVEFDEIPALFASPDQSQWLVRLSNTNFSLIFDRDFLGFTPLSSDIADSHTVE